MDASGNRPNPLILEIRVLVVGSAVIIAAIAGASMLAMPGVAMASPSSRAIR